MKLTRITVTTLALAAFIPSLSPSLRAQGSLTPPAGPPAPGQKTLQQIWDRIGVLEAQNQSLTNLLLSIGQTTGALPWTFTTVDSTGIVGSYTSLAFTPGGEPAISYFDTTIGNLKYAVRAPFAAP
ncbi:MAG: hypothetical protein ACKV19_18210 [Verrucomicrobiales bacterium]